MVCSGQSTRKFSETTGPTEAKFHGAHYGIGEKMESLFKRFRSFVVVNYYRTPEGTGHSAGVLSQIWPRTAEL